MGTIGASNDPKWIENELYSLEKTLAMYQAYAASAPKADKAAWDKRIKGMEERIEEVKKKMEKPKNRVS